MAFAQMKEPTVACKWRTKIRPDGTKYPYIAEDGHETTCKYSVDYIPPRTTEGPPDGMRSNSMHLFSLF